MPVSRGNIGHSGDNVSNDSSDLGVFEQWTENPRVGGSIPPLATIQNQSVGRE